MDICLLRPSRYSTSVDATHSDTVLTAHRRGGNVVGKTPMIDDYLIPMGEPLEPDSQLLHEQWIAAGT